MDKQNGHGAQQGLDTPVGRVAYPGELVVGLSFEQWVERAKENGGFVPAHLVGYGMGQADYFAREGYIRDVLAAGGNPHYGMETRYVYTDGGIGNLARRHGINLEVVPMPED